MIATSQEKLLMGARSLLRQAKCPECARNGMQEVGGECGWCVEREELLDAILDHKSQPDPLSQGRTDRAPRDRCTQSPECGMTDTGHTIRLSDEQLAGVTGTLERWGCREGNKIGDAIHALREVRRLRDGIKALQERCCGNDDLCNGCRVLLALLHLRTDDSMNTTGENRG